MERSPDSADRPSAVARSRTRSDRSGARSSVHRSALGAVMTHFTETPNVQQAAAMETLASTNKELWDIWKAALPQVSAKIPRRGYVSAFNVLFRVAPEPAEQGVVDINPGTFHRLQFNEAEIAVYGRSRLELLDAFGDPAMAYKDYAALGAAEQRAARNELYRKKHERAMRLVLQKVQVGDMLGFKEYTRYIIADKPSEKPECVVLLPSMYLFFRRYETMHPYFVPARCTAYLAKHRLVPLTADAPLQIPDLRGKKPEDFIAIPDLERMQATNQAHAGTRFFQYCAAVYADARMQLPRTYVPRHDVRAASLMLYEHPADPRCFFDAAGTLFYAERPKTFKAAAPSRLRELSHAAPEGPAEA